jgi:hypothetical protein
VTATACPTPLAFTDVVDYWTVDLPAETVVRIEEHVFTCAECARHLAESETLTRAIVDVVRQGRFHSIVSDDVLNRLAREGVRIRYYALEPDDVVPCAIWADDDLVVTRMKADFTAAESVTVVTRLPSGEEISRLSDVPVRPGQSEIIRAIPAAVLRTLPATRVQITVTARIGNIERTIGSYVLEHAGTFDRSSGPTSQ